MVLNWSGDIYVEFVRRADVATFMRCHMNAFEYFGGVPRRCLYDNAKVVVLRRDDSGRPEWNRRMLDFALRMGFEMRLHLPYRAQIKGKVESGVKYVRNNFWPSVRSRDDADLNNLAVERCDVVANERVHGITGRIPKKMLTMERDNMGVLPDRIVGRELEWVLVWGAVVMDRKYGAGGGERLAVHPGSYRRRHQLTLRGQWAGLVNGDGDRRREALAVQMSA